MISFNRFIVELLGFITFVNTNLFCSPTGYSPSGLGPYAQQQAAYMQQQQQSRMPSGMEGVGMGGGGGYGGGGVGYGRQPQQQQQLGYGQPEPGGGYRDAMGIWQPGR